MKVIKIGDLSTKALTFLENLGAKQEVIGENVLLANFFAPLSSDDHNTIKETFNSDKAVLYFENVKKEHFPDNVLLAIDADMCIIHSQCNGRLQHLFLSKNPKQGLTLEGEARTEKGELKQRVDKPDSGNNKDEIFSNKEEVIAPKTDIVLDWITTKLAAIDPMIQNINGSRAMGSVVAYQHYDTKLNGTIQHASLMASFDIELIANSDNMRKMIKLTSNMSQVNPGALSQDNNSARGDANYKGSVIIYPGNDYIYNDRYKFQMPAGWAMDKRVPLTKNANNEYTYTTGWKVGGDISPDPKAPVKLSVSYDSTTQHTVSFLDFELRDNNVNGYCYWEYYFTKADKNPKDLITFLGNVDDLPDLAKTAMVMKNEVTYTAPNNANEWQMFCFNIGHRTVCPKAYTFTYEIDYSGWIGNLWGYFLINMGVVRFP
jgi:hypothetical protein